MYIKKQYYSIQSRGFSFFLFFAAQCSKNKQIPINPPLTTCSRFAKSFVATLFIYLPSTNWYVFYLHAKTNYPTKKGPQLPCDGPIILVTECLPLSSPSMGTFFFCFHFAGTSAKNKRTASCPTAPLSKTEVDKYRVEKRVPRWSIVPVAFPPAAETNAPHRANASYRADQCLVTLITRRLEDGSPLCFPLTSVPLFCRLSKQSSGISLRESFL